MSALGPGQILARRRPFVILILAALRLLAGFCLAWPLSSLVASTGVGLRPEGDRALFEGGGYFLIELLRLRGMELAATARGLLPLLALGLILTTASNVTLLVALNQEGRLDWRGLSSRASERMPAMLVLGAGTVLAQGALVVAGVIAVGAIPELLAKPVTTTLLQGSLWVLVAILLGALGGFSDVVKASLVRHGSALPDGLVRAKNCLVNLPLRATFGWLPWAGGFLIVACAVAKLSGLLDVSRPGAWRVVAVFAAHQLVVVTSVAARAGWFARALRLVSTDA